MTVSATPPWSEPGWLEEASAWIRTELERQGMHLNGPIEQPHVRPWSTVLRVPTDRGALFFKASGRLLANEPALVPVLSRFRCDCVLPVLGVDVERGWMLI